MSNELFLYLVTRADTVGLLLGLMALLSGISVVATAAGIVAFKADGVDPAPWIKGCQISFFCFFGFVISNILLPKTKDLVIIFGGSTLMDVASSPDAKRLGDKTLQVLETWLDENTAKEGK